MDQLAISLFPLAYAGYAQFRIKNYQKVQGKQETISLKVQIGFQLQIALLQLIELFIALVQKDILPAACCLFLLVGLFYSFGVTVIFHYEPLLALLPLVFLFNIISNSYVLKIFDLLSALLSIILALYQHQRKDDPMAYNPFCEFFEQSDSFLCQYVLLLKFQPNTYQEEIELLELNNIQDPLLAQHSQSHTTSQMAQFIINQTRQSGKLDQKHIEPVIMDIVFSKDDDSEEKKVEIHNPHTGIQVIVEENSGSDNKSQESFKKVKEIPIQCGRRSSSLRIIKDPFLEDEQKQQVKSDDEKKEKYPKPFDQFDQEQQNNQEQSNQELNNQENFQQENNIVEIINIDKLGEGESPQKSVPNQQSFPFVEEDEYPNKLIVIPQQIQQELQQSQKQKKRRIKDEGLIAKKNRMMKRIKSYEEFQVKNDDNNTDDKKSDYEKYKDEVSSATLSEDESESGVYVQQKMEKVQFQVGRQITKKIVNYQVKHLIQINVKVQSESWTQLCQYVELYQIANGHLPKPTVGDADIEKKLFYIQQWLDGMSQNPLLMRKEVLEYFKVPETIVNKYGLIKKIEEEKRVSRPSNKFMNSTQKDYFLKIKEIDVECLGQQTNNEIIYFKLRFTIVLETKKLLCECLKTIDDIKEATRIIQAERNLRVSLQEHETSKKQIQAIVQFLQELFSHQFYYCDRLFDQFDLLALVK